MRGSGRSVKVQNGSVLNLGYQVYFNFLHDLHKGRHLRNTIFLGEICFDSPGRLLSGK